MSSPVTYFHGGAPGLKKGDFILPACETRVKSCADYGAEGVCRKDRVYLVTDLTAAIMFGAMHPSKKGTVYEVEPIGTVEHDPDCDTKGLSFQAERAKILREIPITPRQRKIVMRSFGVAA